MPCMREKQKGKAQQMSEWDDWGESEVCQVLVEEKKETCLCPHSERAQLKQRTQLLVRALVAFLVFFFMLHFFNL